MLAGALFVTEGNRIWKPFLVSSCCTNGKDRSVSGDDGLDEERAGGWRWASRRLFSKKGAIT